MNLKYTPSVHAHGGSGEIVLVKPVETHGNPRVMGSLYSLGKVGGKEFISLDAIEPWVTEALLQELTEAGYTVRTAPRLPDSAPRGLEVAISRVHLVEGDWRESRSDVNIEITVHSHGEAKVLVVKSKGNCLASENLGVWPATFEISIDRALQQALGKAVPEIVKIFEASGHGRQG